MMIMVMMIIIIFFIRRNEDFLGTDGIAKQAKSFTQREGTRAAGVQKVSFIFEELCVFTG